MKHLKFFANGFVTGFKEFGELLSSVFNFILLLIVYFTALGITSLVGKTVNKKFLELSANKNKKSYWNKRSLKRKALRDYYRPF